MVCEKCKFDCIRNNNNFIFCLGTKKLGRIVTVDPYRTKQRNESTLGKTPKVTGTENKLLTTKKDRYILFSQKYIYYSSHSFCSYQPYKQSFERCRICKHSVHQLGSHYCQTCAYQKGICAMCGQRIIDTRQFKQSCE